MVTTRRRFPAASSTISRHGRTRRGLSHWTSAGNTIPAMVRVLDGAFSSCLGLFERVGDNERVAILLDLLGRKVRVVIGVDEVAAA